MNMFKKNGGFTLVELIVVIAILAILAGVAVPAYSGYIAKAKEAADLTMLDSVKTAIVFEAIEKDAGHDCKVTGATVTAGSTEVVISGEKIDITDNKVNISAYVEEIVFTSGATGATWNGTEWTLTK